jgi:prepilin-type processing-associated H-X9-DG protein
LELVMEQDLLGYVLNALEPKAHAEVEAQLARHPEVQERLEFLRQTLEPLALDPNAAPPAGLADRVVAEVQASGPLAPKAPVTVRAWPLRRIFELTAAAVVVLTVTGLVAVWIARLRDQRPGGEPNATQLVECKNNLHRLYLSLRSYSDLHQRQFPNVATALEPPRNVAGLVYPILHDSGSLGDARLSCPGAGGPTPCAIGMQDVRAMNDVTFQGWSQGLHNCYAYSLGYRSSGVVMGIKLDDNKPSSLIPLMADSSPPDPAHGNSPHHGGRGQNVLYCDGHVTFCQSRHVGYQQDDIYLNRAGKVAAGVDWFDTVLTSSASPP